MGIRTARRTRLAEHAQVAPDAEVLAPQRGILAVGGPGAGLLLGLGG
jgi:hypothetical protein